MGAIAGEVVKPLNKQQRLPLACREGIATMPNTVLSFLRVDKDSYGTRSSRQIADRESDKVQGGRDSG